MEKSMVGKASSAHFVSWRHRTSGCTCCTHASTRCRRAPSELTFHVASRIGGERYRRRPMQARLWRDYLCPWCHLGRDRTALLESIGVEVTPLAYELHPEIPLEGRAVRPDERLAGVLAHIAAECEAVGLPFRAPTRIANTRRALEVAELVRRDHATAFPAVDAALYDAQWVHDQDLGNPAVVDEILVAAGVDPGAIGAAVEAGEGTRAVEA